MPAGHRGGVMTVIIHGSSQHNNYVHELEQQNADLVAALEEIEILGRDIRSTLATSMGNIARQALAQVTNKG